MRKWVYLDDNVHIVLDSRLLFVVNALGSIFKNKNTLFLIDDMAYSDEIKKRSGDFVKLVFSLRHYGITLWVLTQKYNDIVKSVRSNAFMVITFHMPDLEAMKNLLYENGIEKEDHKEIREFLKNNKKAKLIIRNEFPCNHWLIND